MAAPEIRFTTAQDDWELLDLDQNAIYSKGRGYSKNDLVKTGTPVVLYGRLYTNFETEIDQVDTFVRPFQDSVISSGNEVIVPASGETPEDIARASAVVRSGYILASDLNIIHPNSKLNPTFLASSLTYGAASKDIRSKAQGNVVVHLKNDDIRSLQIFAPSLAEQVKINLFFRHIDNQIKILKKSAKHLKNHKQSMLFKMFPQGGASVPEIRFEGFTDNWQRKSLEMMMNLGSGRDYKHLSEGDVPVYGTGGYMCSVNSALSTSEDAVGIGRKGSINSPYLLRAPFWTVDTLFFAIPHKNVDLDFLYAVFQTINWSTYDESTGVPSLSKDTIYSVEAYAPSSEEQAAIGSYFRRLDRLIELEEAKLAKLTQLKTAFLSKMFV